MTTQRIYNPEPEWVRRARENKLPAKVTGGRKA